MDTAIVLVDWSHSVEGLYRADADRLWRALRAFTGDDETANEAVAEAFAQLLRRGPSVRDPAAWVWRTAFRIAAGHLKGRLPRLDIAVHDRPYHDRHVDHDLLSALQRLPDAQRAAVILFYFVDLPVRDIAARLGTHAFAVRANLSRGRKRLRDLLGDDHG